MSTRAKRKPSPSPAKSSKPSESSVAQAPAAVADRPDQLPLRRDRRALLIAGALALLVLLVFSQAGTYPFITLDDSIAITNNPHVNKGLTRDGVEWAFTDLQTFYWQPLTYLSHMLDVDLFGLTAGGPHLVNVFLHCLSTIVLFLLLRKLTGFLWRSAAVAALFAVHPLRVESVVWVAERKDVLCTLFFLLAALAYAGYAQGMHRRRNYGLFTVFGILSMMAKPMAVTLPVALLILDYWPLHRLRKRADLFRLLREKLPLLVFALVVSFLTYQSNQYPGKSLPFSVLPLSVRVGNVLTGYVDYLGKTLWPFSLAVFYPYRIPSSASVVFSAAFLLIVTASAFVARKRNPWILAGWTWFVLLLLPAAGLIQAGEQRIADRFTYLPHVGLFIVAVWGGFELAHRLNPERQRLAAAAGAAAVLLLAIAAFVQVRAWQDSRTLYAHALSVTKNNLRMLRTVSTEYLSQGKIDDAVNAFREIVRVEPGRAENHYRLGELLILQQHREEAIKQFETALNLQPDNSVVRKTLATNLMIQGDLSEAADQLQRVVKSVPEDLEARQLLETLPQSQSAGRVQREIEAAKPNPPPPDVINGELSDQEYWEIVAVILAILLSLVAPYTGATRFRRIEAAITRFAANRRRAVIAAGVLPLMIRLVILPAFPIPQPSIADEFGHLLIADTLASGRLTNPPHAMWRHFESIYVLSHPTYTSIYPIGQGVVMALAKVIGLAPWFGVWLSVGLMCSLICWMLQGWLPPRWAFLGAMIAVLRFAVMGHWMNSYWGGAVAVIGGALTFGALPRIIARQRMRDAIWFALGLALLSQTRPYEGLILATPACLFLAVWLVTARDVAWGARLQRVAAPLLAAVAVLVAGTLFYNFRVTANPLELPYKLYQQEYGVPQSFVYQPPIPPKPGVYHHKDLLDNYKWQLENHEIARSWSRFAEATGDKLWTFWHFFLGPALTLGLLFLPFVVRNKRFAFLAACCGMVLLGISAYPFFFPHYAAPITALLIALIVQGFRHLRTLRWHGRPMGLFLLPATFLIITTMILFPAGSDLLTAASIRSRTPRTQVLDILNQAGGNHLVLVRYGPQHNFHAGSIYNDADIDNSRIVWARELSDAENQALINYFKGRTVWLLEADEHPARLSPWKNATQPLPPAVTAAPSDAGGSQ